MSRDTPIERRVSRLENDATSIYELISEIQSTQQDHSDLISEIQSTQQEHSRRFDAVDKRFDSIEATLTEVVRRLPEPA